MDDGEAPRKMSSVGQDALAPVALSGVFRAVPDSYLVLASDFTIVEASDAYLRATMTTRGDIVGRGIFDVFPDDPDDAAANGVANLRASLNRVIAHRRPDTMPVQRYPVRRPASLGGEFEERYWSPMNGPVLDHTGRVAYIIHRVEDVTELVKLKKDLLERGRALDEVAARSERVSKLLDTAPDAIVIVGEDGAIQLVNMQTELMFGYTREELVGKRLELLIPERFRHSHSNHMSRYMAAPGARPMGSGLQLYGRRKDASEIPIEVSLSPQLEATGMTVSASIRDISERKRLEAAARLMAERLASAVDSIQDAFALFDSEDRLILCNSVFRRLVRAGDTKALVGRLYSEVLAAWLEDMEFPDEAAREAFRRERVDRRRHEQTTTFDIRLKDGRALRVSDRRTPEGGIVKTIWDLTEDEHRAEELREARAAAEAASAAKSEFLSSMSHELRTPLNAILGFAQLLERDKKEPLGDRHKERVEHILRGGKHLLRLINDILDLSRIEAGRVPMSPEPVDVKDVLDEVYQTLEPIAAREQISLFVEHLPSALPWVFADRTRFAQILMNFGSNAIKYNRREGSARFVVSMPAPDRVRVSVVDDGVGIPEHHQAKLFQPFQRAGQEAGPIEGTGIGLAITKRLAELMKGSVGFRSEAGKGSEFWVEVPVLETAAAAPSEPPLPEPDIATEDERGLSLVLYVEDNPANVVFMRDLVSSVDGIDLVTVPTAELGVAFARARRPAIVIMDINLPGMSGLDALRALRAAPETEDIPVIAVTAAASERDQHRGRQAGFHSYFTKPLNVGEFIDALESLLKSS